MVFAAPCHVLGGYTYRKSTAHSCEVESVNRATESQLSLIPGICVVAVNKLVSLRAVGPWCLPFSAPPPGSFSTSSFSTTVMTLGRRSNNKTYPTLPFLSSFLLHFGYTGTTRWYLYHIHSNMLRDILFYVWLLIVLPTLAYCQDKLIEWLWWYPPHLRRMRIF